MGNCSVERKCYYEIVGLETRNDEVGDSNCCWIIFLRRMNFYVYVGYLGVKGEPGFWEVIPMGHD
jgi:hypothetical protein